VRSDIAAHWHLRPRTLRWRLTLAVGAVLVMAFIATFIVVYSTTDSRLRSQINADLRNAAEPLATALSNAKAGGMAAAADSYVTSQPFSSSSRLLYAVVGGHIYTNEKEVFNLAGPDDDSPATARLEVTLAREILRRPPGLWTQEGPDVGALRLLVQAVQGRAGATATIGVGEPLTPIDNALDGIQRGFAIGGTITLAAALLLGFLLAAGFARPLTRMAQIAARVDAGDLSPRIEAQGPRNEMRILADTFDHMLDRLEEAFARQQAFISDASHELRTPLTSIRGQIEVLARSEHPDGEEVRRVERVVAAEVDRMTRLTDDLLLLAHTDESHFIEREAVELELLLEDLVAIAEPTADRRFTLAAHAPGILNADPDRVTQALRNLLRNAIEHSQPGGAIELGARELPGERVAIWVDDDGPGIPASERERVFDRFHRADPARVRTGGGTGLGLAIVRAIVTAHGGRVWAEESPLGGARVAIELPGYRRMRHGTLLGVGTCADPATGTCAGRRAGACTRPHCPLGSFGPCAARSRRHALAAMSRVSHVRHRSPRRAARQALHGATRVAPRPQHSPVTSRGGPAGAKSRRS
jgi:two-component system, OmpR family, sensor kinase